MKLRRDVVFNPLVDGLWRGVCLYLLQQLLLQLQQWEQEAQALPLQDLQHAILVLVDFCKEQGVWYSDGGVTMRTTVASLGCILNLYRPYWFDVALECLYLGASSAC